MVYLFNNWKNKYNCKKTRTTNGRYGNWRNNLITNKNFSYDKLLNKITTLKINLSDNHLNYDEFPEKLRLKCNLIRQNTYIHNKIDFGNVGNENIRAFVNYDANRLAIIIDDTRTNQLFGPQSINCFCNFNLKKRFIMHNL